MGILTFDREAFRELIDQYNGPDDHSDEDVAWWAEHSETPAPIGTATVTFPAVTLAGELEADIDYYIGMATDYGDFMAGVLGSILRRVRFTGARTVGEYLDRRAAMDAEGGR